MTLWPFLTFCLQFWAVYVPCGAQFLNAAQITLEQIDIIKRMISKYSELLGYADSHDRKFNIKLLALILYNIGVIGLAFAINL